MCALNQPAIIHQMQMNQNIPQRIQAYYLSTMFTIVLFS